MKKVCIFIALLFISSIIPIVNSDSPTPGIFLIDTPEDWVTAGFELAGLPIYNNEGLVEFWMPIAFKKEDVNVILPKDVSHTIYNNNANFDERFDSIDFEIMESSTYWVVVYHMKVKASDEPFSIDFVPKIKGEELYQYAWWNSSWDHRVKITLGNYFFNPLTDFTVLVQLNASISGDCDGGDSVRFINDGNDTEYDFELDNGSFVNDSSNYYWVQIPYCVNGTVFYLYYNNSDAANSEDIEGTWNSDYMAVHHLDDLTTASTEDSTSNSNDGIKTAVDNPLEVSAVINEGQEYDGTDDYDGLKDDDTLSFVEYPMSLECWFEIDDTTPNYQMLMGKRDGSDMELELYVYVGATAAQKGIQLILRDDNVNGYIKGHWNQPLRSNVWYHMIVTYDGGTEKEGIQFYINGSAVGMSYAEDTDYVAMENLGADFQLGNFEVNNNQVLDGTQDEARIAREEWNSSWCYATYWTMVAGDFVTFGDIEDVPEEEEEDVDATPYYGDAFSWLSASSIRAVGVKPADIKLNNNGFIVAEFSDNQEEYIQANMMIPYNANLSRNMSICVGWSSPTVNKTCDWEITYLITAPGNDTDIVGETNQSYSQSNLTADGLVMHTLFIFNSSNYTSDDICLHLQVMRDGNDAADTIGDIVEVHGMALGYFLADKYTNNETTSSSSSNFGSGYIVPTSNMIGYFGLFGILSIMTLTLFIGKKKQKGRK